MIRTIAAVKYACNGEASKGLEIPPFKTYNLQPTHDIFEHGEVSELSHFIGMPLVVQQLRPFLLKVFRPVSCGPGGRRPQMPREHETKGRRKGDGDDEGETVYASYDSKHGANYFPNDTAARLMRVCSSSTITPLFSPPAKWLERVGIVLIARQDMVPLHPMHIEILKSFITAVRKTLTEQSDGHAITADAIAETLTPSM